MESELKISESKREQEIERTIVFNESSDELPTQLTETTNLETMDVLPSIEVMEAADVGNHEGEEVNTESQVSLIQIPVEIGHKDQEHNKSVSVATSDENTDEDALRILQELQNQVNVAMNKPLEDSEGHTDLYTVATQLKTVTQQELEERKNMKAALQRMTKNLKHVQKLYYDRVVRVKEKIDGDTKSQDGGDVLEYPQKSASRAQKESRNKALKQVIFLAGKLKNAISSMNEIDTVVRSASAIVKFPWNLGRVARIRCICNSLANCRYTLRKMAAERAAVINIFNGAIRELMIHKGLNPNGRQGIRHYQVHLPSVARKVLGDVLKESRELAEYNKGLDPGKASYKQVSFQSEKSLRAELASVKRANVHLEADLKGKDQQLRQLQEQNGVAGDTDQANGFEKHLKATIRKQIEEIAKLKNELDGHRKNTSPHQKLAEDGNWTMNQFGDKYQQDLRKIQRVIEPLRYDNYELRATIEVDRKTNERENVKVQKQMDQLQKSFEKTKLERASLAEKSCELSLQVQSLKNELANQIKLLKRTDREKQTLRQKNDVIWAEKGTVTEQLASTNINLEKANSEVSQLRDKITKLENLVNSNTDIQLTQMQNEHKAIIRIKEENFMEKINILNSQRMRFRDKIFTIEGKLQGSNEREMSYSYKVCQLEQEKASLLADLNETKVNLEILRQKNGQTDGMMSLDGLNDSKYEPPDLKNDLEIEEVFHNQPKRKQRRRTRRKSDEKREKVKRGTEIDVISSESEFTDANDDNTADRQGVAKRSHENADRSENQKFQNYPKNCDDQPSPLIESDGLAKSSDSVDGATTTPESTTEGTLQQSISKATTDATDDGDGESMTASSFVSLQPGGDTFGELRKTLAEKMAESGDTTETE